MSTRQLSNTWPHSNDTEWHDNLVFNSLTLPKITFGTRCVYSPAYAIVRLLMKYESKKPESLQADFYQRRVRPCMIMLTILGTLPRLSPSSEFTWVKSAQKIRICTVTLNRRVYSKIFKFTDMAKYVYREKNILFTFKCFHAVLKQM